MDVTPTTLLVEIQEKLDDVSREEHNYVGAAGAKFADIRQALYHRRSQVVTKLPYFWLRVLIAHPALSLFITDVDSRILSHLANIHVATVPNTNDFDLVFTFSQNPFFEDSSLLKRFTYSDRYGRVVALHQISWKPPANHLLARKGPRDAPSRFFKWIAQDALDISHLGELIRDEIHPHAIDLFFGTYSMQH